MVRAYKLGLLFFAVLCFSCNKEEEKTPEQIERDEIIEIENQLRNNRWGFVDMKVNVLYESRATPLLANVADENGMVQPGEYDSYEIFGNGDRQANYTYEFSRDEITVDTLGLGNYTRFGGYYVIDTEKIRINPDVTNAIPFDYEYDGEEGKFFFEAESPNSTRFIEALNEKITYRILSGKPGDVADAIVEKILGSEEISLTIQEFLVDLLDGKIQEITEDPERIAEVLAQKIVDKLKEQDWETIVYEKVLEILQEIFPGSAEEKAQELAKEIALRIETSLSVENIKDAILPLLEHVENETLPALAIRVSETVYKIVAENMSEEKLANRVENAWIEFATVSDTTIQNTANALGTVLVDHFFDEDTLTNRFIPFVTKVDQESAISVAQEIIDDVLVPIVDVLNEEYGLELEPNWSQIKIALTGALKVLKSSIEEGTSIEDASRSLAQTTINIFDALVSRAIEETLYRLQTVDPEVAGQVIAAWIINLDGIAEEAIVSFLEDKLNEIFAQFNAEEISDELAELIHLKVTEVLNEEKLYEIILPILETQHQLKLEVIAKIITDWLINSGVIEDNITEEQVVEVIIVALTEVLTQVLAGVDTKKVSEILVEAILSSDVVQNIDGTLLKRFIEVKLYELLVTVSSNINAIDKYELVIIKK